MKDGAIISKADFARRCGVTGACVSQWLRDGKIGPEALVGRGRRARVRADLALEMLRSRLDHARCSPHMANLDDRANERFAAWVFAVAEEAGRVIEEVCGAIPGWAEELITAAARDGGVDTVSGLLRTKSTEVGDDIEKLVGAVIVECCHLKD